MVYIGHSTVAAVNVGTNCHPCPPLLRQARSRGSPGTLDRLGVSVISRLNIPQNGTFIWHLTPSRWGVGSFAVERVPLLCQEARSFAVIDLPLVRGRAYTGGMAGRPKRRAMILELEARARTYEAEDGGDGSILDYVCGWIASGKTIAALAEDLSGQLKFPYSREALSKYVNGLEPDARARLVAARETGGHALAEDTLDIADATEKLGVTKEDIASAKLRIEARQRLAGWWNPKELGTKGPETNVQISIGALHLDALRRRSVRATVLQPLLTAPVEDAEIVPED